MKTTKTLTYDELLRRLRQKTYSDDGFLGEGLDLKQVIAEDMATIGAMGITYQQLADRIQYITGRADHLCNEWDLANKRKESIWDRIKEGFIVDKDWKVTWVSYCGYQDCPWGCEGREALSDSDYTVTRISTGKSVFFSELHPHLMAKHSFCEAGTPYRLDPKEAAAVLGVEPGVNYSPSYASYKVWHCGCSSGGSGYTEEEYKESLERFLSWSTGTDKPKPRKVLESGINQPAPDGVTIKVLGDSALVITRKRDHFEDRIEKIDGSIVRSPNFCGEVSFSSLYRTDYKYVLPRAKEDVIVTPLGTFKRSEMPNVIGCLFP